MTEEQKAAIVAKLEELTGYIAQSLPLRAVGGGHVYNELATLKAEVEAIVIPAPEPTPTA